MASYNQNFFAWSTAYYILIIDLLKVKWGHLKVYVLFEKMPTNLREFF